VSNFGAQLSGGDRDKGNASFLARPAPQMTSVASTTGTSGPSLFGFGTQTGFGAQTQASTNSLFNSRSTSDSKSNSTPETGFGSSPSNKSSGGLFYPPSTPNSVFGSAFGKSPVTFGSSTGSGSLFGTSGSSTQSSSSGLFGSIPQGDKGKGSSKGNSNPPPYSYSQGDTHKERRLIDEGWDSYESITALPAFRDYSFEVS
jgi:hypothetical protein